jgi:hypothetical protein
LIRRWLVAKHHHHQWQLITPLLRVLAIFSFQLRAYFNRLDHFKSNYV